MSTIHIFAPAHIKALRTSLLKAEPAPCFFDRYNNPKK